MQLNQEIKTSLNREYILCENAAAFYKKAIKAFERKYHIASRTFLKRFDAGRMGDDADFFDWYAYAKLLDQWQKTCSAIRSTVL